MKKPKSAILWLPGKNRYRESEWSLKHVGFEVEHVFMNDLLSRKARVLDYHLLFDIGGFGFGDYNFAGSLAGKYFSHPNVKPDMEKFVEEGRPMIMVCNGFQDGVVSGLLSTSRKPFGEIDLALYDTDIGRFLDYPVNLKNVNRGKCVWTKGLEGLLIPMHMDNGEGKLITKGQYRGDNAALKKLWKNDQVVFLYAAPDGKKLGKKEKNLRVDPTGSVDHIAGVCNYQGNILGMMPHPETTNPLSDPLWTRDGIRSEPSGLALFRNAYEHVKSLR